MSTVCATYTQKVEKMTVGSYNPDIVGIHLHPFQHSSSIPYSYKSVYLAKHLPDYLPRKVGRPSKATQETFDTIIEGIRKGLPYVRAANDAGISYDTFNRWKKKGESGEYPFVEFAEDINKELSRAFLNLIGSIYEGLTYKQACKNGGIAYQTLLNWKHKKDEPGYEDVYYIIKWAEANGEYNLLARINAAGCGKVPYKWQDCARILEKRYPERWGVKYRSPIIVDEW